MFTDTADDFKVFTDSFSAAAFHKVEVSLDFTVTIKFSLDSFALIQSVSAHLIHFTATHLMLHDFLSELFVDEALLKR